MIPQEFKEVRPPKIETHFNLGRSDLPMLLAIAIIVSSALTAYTIVSAQPENITFPVAELGGCRNEVECKLYCDKPENISACVDFAEQNGLMDKEEVSRARAFVAAGNKGPGGCAGQDSCEAYCEDTSHLNECLAFAEAHDLMDSDELEEAKKVAAALASGAALPGGCKNKSECDAYCQAPANIEECLLFAEKAGFLSGKELEEARRVAPLIARGETPGGCVRKEQCEAYCSDEANMNECAEFAIKAGFMSAEDAEMYRKTGGKGPGNCRSKESCEAFCNDSANQEECFRFAKEHDLLSEEDMARMREGIEQIQSALETTPDEVRGCIREQIGEETMGRIESGNFMPSREMGDAIQGCFEEMIPRELMVPTQGPEMMPRDVPEEFRGEIREHIQDETREWIERGRPRAEEEMQNIREQIESEAREQIESQTREQIYREYVPPQENVEPRMEFTPPAEMMVPALGPAPIETPEFTPTETSEPTSLWENSLFGMAVRALLGR